MAKNKQKAKKDLERIKTNKPVSESGLRGFLAIHPNIIPLGILLVLLLILYHEVMLGGKTFLPPDKLASRSSKQFLESAFDKNEYPLWCPYIFGGMPSFASLASAPLVDILGEGIRIIIWPLKKIIPGSDFTFAFFNYYLLGIFTYIFLFRKTKQHSIALFAALSMVFQPGVVAFGAFGHGTKLTTIVLIPIIFLLLDQFLEKKQLKYFALFALAIGLQLLRAHTQMAYYTFMMIGLYLIFWTIHSKVKKADWSQILKPVGLIVVALVIGIAMSSWLYISVLEYADYSIRGGAAGLDYGYATSWSFAPKEIVTFFVPSFLGFGGQTYWGGMPFTDFPLYMGIIPLMLAGAALTVRRDKYTLFFGVMGLLALLISFGKEFPVLYGPLFELLPFFNKFRVPSMILILLQFAVVTLAALGLSRILALQEQASRERLAKFLYIFAGVCGAIMLFMLAAKSTYLGWVASSGKQLGAPAQLAAYDMAAVDSVKVFFLALAGIVLILMFVRKRLNATLFLAAITALTVLDLWLVDFKIANPQPKTNQTRYFAETEAVQFLKKVNEPFRIYQAYDDKAPNWYMYHKIQNIQGYHAAKIKIYQNFLEKVKFDPSMRNRYGFSAFMDKYYQVVVKNGQPSLQQRPPGQISPARFASDYAALDMLNVKYLISHYPIPDERFKPVVQSRPYVFENTGVLPRAFFVEEVKIMPDENVFFDYLASGTFNPAREAVLQKNIPQKIAASDENTVSVIVYENHEIGLKASVKTPSLMVLSEVYYPAGWQAFVDGKETEIYQTNGILRSIFLEPGEHEITFEFKPTAFTLGLCITIITFLLMLGLLVYDLKFGRKATL